MDETLAAPFRLFEFDSLLCLSKTQMALDARKRRLRWICFDKLQWKDKFLDRFPLFHLSSKPRVTFFECELYPGELKAAGIPHYQVVFEAQDFHQFCFLLFWWKSFFSGDFWRMVLDCRNRVPTYHTIGLEPNVSHLLHRRWTSHHLCCLDPSVDMSIQWLAWCSHLRFSVDRSRWSFP